MKKRALDQGAFFSSIILQKMKAFGRAFGRVRSGRSFKGAGDFS